MTQALRYWLLRGWLFLLPLAAMACTKQPELRLPPPPPSIVEAAVAVPVPCEIARVDQPAYPAKQARRGDDIFTLAKIALADRRVRIGETAQLRAANNTPCSGVTP